MVFSNRIVIGLLIFIILISSYFLILDKFFFLLILFFSIFEIYKINIYTIRKIENLFFFLILILFFLILHFIKNEFVFILYLIDEIHFTLFDGQPNFLINIFFCEDPLTKSKSGSQFFFIYF